MSLFLTSPASYSTLPMTSPWYIPYCLCFLLSVYGYSVAVYSVYFPIYRFHRQTLRNPYRLLRAVYCCLRNVLSTNVHAPWLVPTAHSCKGDLHRLPGCPIPRLYFPLIQSLPAHRRHRTIVITHHTTTLHHPHQPMVALIQLPSLNVISPSSSVLIQKFLGDLDK